MERLILLTVISHYSITTVFADGPLTGTLSLEYNLDFRTS